MEPFRVLVVDDSAFMRKIFSDFIERDALFQVVGTAENGQEAVRKVKELNPDAVTLDVEMPEMNGLDALKFIMELGPRPVIMLSGLNEEGMKETILALEAGAFDFIRKPSITNALGIEQVGQELMKQLHAAMQAKQRRALWEEEERARQAAQHQTSSSRASKPLGKLADKKPSAKELPQAGHIRANAAEVLARQEPPTVGEEKRRIREVLPGTDPLRRKPAAPEKRRKPESPKPSSAGADSRPADNGPSSLAAITDLVAVGCSTGGPRALKAFLEGIPSGFHAPIVIVQHMPPKFTKSLAQRLNSFSGLEVLEAADGMPLEPGKAYIAPGGSHIRVRRTEKNGYVIATSMDEPRNGHRPSVDTLFESLLPLTELTRHAILMTGMGSDGARMMKKLYDSGVKSTFAESEETCVVYGMPRSAVELGCVNDVLPLQELAPKVVQAVNNRK
ncbi:protein-glutamate methylesterase/protein-glutamine glutaminase [Paenibacillus lactis]|uniref:protein-glutamate methylesterase/protein-glutamine glutaminase n=1 Tax=Paenibacillus lactis TaxID=228574 RepID=UPI0036AB2ACC